MSAWIIGSEIAASLGLFDFEFAHEFVARGLQPHNGQGQPYRPVDVVQQFIAGLEHELAQHEDTASNLSWGDRDEIIANHVGPLNKRIQGYRLYLESLNGTGWQNFELPQDQDLSRHFIQTLLNSYYSRDEVKRRLLPQPESVPHQEQVHPAQIVAQAEISAKQQKDRPERRHKKACREIAERLWRDNPEITISDMTISDEINEACEGKYYKDEKTIRNWIKNLCPNPKPGRPKKKPS